MSLFDDPTQQELDDAFDRTFLVEGIVTRVQAKPALDLLIRTSRYTAALGVPVDYAWMPYDFILKLASVGVPCTPEQIETIASVKTRMKQYLADERNR